MIKTYKQLIIKFLELRNKKIKSFTGIVYMTKKDFKAIEKWSEEDCEKIWKELKKNIYRGCNIVITNELYREIMNDSLL